MRSDPTATFRQEAQELLQQLEAMLLDLGQRPADRDLVDGAFRALHTLKGSGAMFGFDAVAAFVHDFETAFDLVRQGRAPVTEALVTLALAAGDHVAGLIADPSDEHDAAGEAILSQLRTTVLGATRGSPVATRAEAPATGRATWQIRFALPPDALAHGTNPVLLLDELRELGECVVTADCEAVPELELLRPERSYLAWNVTLTT
ncbi:MAG: Hpt domain-containing protein, partial [Devosia sp.]